MLVFTDPVPGLLVGAGVLFNGIRVGEVTALELVPERPREVHATDRRCRAHAGA